MSFKSKAAAAVFSYGAKKVADTMAANGVNPADAIFNGVNDFVGQRKASAAKKSGKITPTDAALSRLSAISSSLEEDDEHQMISDIMLLVREGSKMNDEQVANWVSSLYGRPIHKPTS